MPHFNQNGRAPLRELIVLALIAAPLLVAASVMEAADWVDGLPSLKAVVLVSLPAFALLSRSRAPFWLAHPVGLVASVVGGFVIAAFTLSEIRGTGDLASEIRTWFGAVGSQEGNQGESMTGVILTGFTLLMVYLSVWLCYRLRHPLPAALPGLAAVLIVLTFLPQDFYWYFFAYLLAAAPGIAYRHRGRWAEHGQRLRLAGALVGGLALMAVAVGAASQVPSPKGTVIPLTSTLEDPWYSFRDSWSDLFHGVPSRHNWPFFSPPLQLPFTGPIEPSDELLFVVESDKPYRWRMRVYETYTRAGWVTDWGLDQESLSQAGLAQSVEGLEERREVSIATRMFSKANALLTAGEPLVADVKSSVELSPTPTFTLNLVGPQTGYIPTEVEEVRQRLMESVISRTDSLRVTDNEALDEMGFRFVQDPGLEAEDDVQQLQVADGIAVLERAQPGRSPTLALLSERVLVPPYRYETVGSISVATPKLLREAGQDYPAEVSDRYLQLPDDFPQSVSSLAAELADPHENPYDKAEVIRRYLLGLPYNLNISTPAPGQDYVEHFLMVERSGYCQYFASAMITMLRSVGVPARLVVGFAPGIRDRERGQWIIQAKHYHAWPEVYFPRYGWVEFEATPANVQPSLEELGFLRTASADSGLTPEDECMLIFGPEVCADVLARESGIHGAILDDLPAPEDLPEATGPPADGFGLGRLSWALVAAGLAAVVLVPLVIFAYLRWSTGILGHGTVLFAMMDSLGRVSGVERRDEETPLEHGARLADVFPDHANTIAKITDGFVFVRYGPEKRLPPEQADDLRRSWPPVRNALLKRILLRMVRLGRRPR